MDTIFAILLGASLVAAVVGLFVFDRLSSTRDKLALSVNLIVLSVIFGYVAHRSHANSTVSAPTQIIYLMLSIICAVSVIAFWLYIFYIRRFRNKRGSAPTSR